MDTATGGGTGPERLERAEDDRSESTAPAPLAASALPGWYPGWVRELAERFYAGTSCVFVLHGNVHDLVRGPAEDGPDAYVDLIDCLALNVFGSWDIVLSYDLARGLRTVAGSDVRRKLTMDEEVAARVGDLARLSRDPSQVLAQLDAMIQSILMEKAGGPRKRACMLFEYAQYLLPEGDLATLNPAQEANLIRFLSWARNPYIKRVNMLFCLVAERLSEVNERLVQNPHVATIQVPLPDRAERQRYIEWFATQNDLASRTDYTVDQLADLTNGLSLLNIQILLTQGAATGGKLDAATFQRQKKDRIEQQCQGLLEFVEPSYNLDMVVGHEAVKNRLRADAELLRRGELASLPMGYLVCGPVGTGKSFLSECYAGSVGIPCVTLKNFRSKYVGETEGNLEHVLSVLRSLGPVVVVIDEADAALGTRQASGDSGTSSRVFGMIARQMGDTRYRGQILWMLLTSRPDLLPIDLKRQGRAEVHIPLFYPVDDAEVRTMLAAMARKNRVTVEPGAVDSLDPGEQRLSGSDLESVLLGAKRASLAAGRDTVTAADLQAALQRFLPSAEGLEKEMQELAAVLECTDLEYLPEQWREKVTSPGGRALIQERMVAIKQLLREF